MPYVDIMAEVGVTKYKYFLQIFSSISNSCTEVNNGTNKSLILVQLKKARKKKKMLVQHSVKIT